MYLGKRTWLQGNARSADPTGEAPGGPGEEEAWWADEEQNIDIRRDSVRSITTDMSVVL